MTRRARPWRRRLAAGVLAVLGLGIAARLGLTLVSLPPALFLAPPSELELTDASGRPLRFERPDADAPHGRPLGYAAIPAALVRATLAAEDHRFWTHPGVDWRATTRAAWQLVTHRRVISGGSTITQQLIKLAHPRPRTFRSKFIEALQALRLEQIWDKQSILAAYLNRLDYGDDNTGCTAAAAWFFGQPPADLSAAECALLAGLPQAPARLNPRRHPERARKRAQWILSQELALGWLAPDEQARAAAEPLRFAPPRRPFEAPHFVDCVLAHAGRPPAPGIAPATTLDLALNRFAAGTVRRQLARLRENQVHDAAVVVLDNRSGAVLALVGSGDYFAPGAGQVNGAWAPRSPGSALKPFAYLLAFERGTTAATLLADVPAEFPTPTGLFAPVNYDRRCSGPASCRVALANSLNLPAVRLLDQLGGPAPLIERLQACGLTTLDRPADEYGLGLTLGNAETRLVELANAYATLARLGEYRPCRWWRDQPAIPARRVADAGAAWLVADILADNDARLLSFGSDTPLRFAFPVACKTGTSSNFRDNWAFGFTPEFTVGVWAGNFDASPMHGVSGVAGAAPILHEVFDHLHATRGTSWYTNPPGLVVCEIDPLTGRRLPAGAPLPANPTREKFLPGVLPPPASPTDYDSAGRVQLGAEYCDWLAGPENWLAGRAVAREDGSAPRITFPPPGTLFYLDPDLPNRGALVTPQANGGPDLVWTSESLGVATQAGRTTVTLQTGRHRLRVADARTGAAAETWLEVRDR